MNVANCTGKDGQNYENMVRIGECEGHVEGNNGELN